MRVALVSVGLAVVSLSAAAATNRGVTSATSPPAQAPAPARPDTTAGTATVRGTVRDATTGQPIRRATVFLRVTPALASGAGAADRGESLRTSTDASGAFEFTGVAAGRATVVASKDGYYDPAVTWNGAPAGGGGPAALSLAAGQLIEGIAITLSPAGAIVGRVVDEFGDPAASIAIEVLRREDGRRGLLQTAGRRSESDDTGTFRVWGLAPGEYLVAARPRQMDVEGRPGQSADRDGFALTYYPGTSAVADAAPVVVRAGRDTSGVAFPLVTTRLAVIRGQVVGMDARAATRVTVMVSRIDRHRLGNGATGSSAGADGVFEVTRVPPGRYNLTAREGADGPWGPLNRAGSVEVDVDGADVDGVTIPLGPGATVRGRVVDERGQPVRRPLRVQLSQSSRDFAGGVAPPAPVEVAADGSFHATGLFGPLYVRLLTGGPTPMPLEAAQARTERQASGDPPLGITALSVGSVDMLDRAIPFAGEAVEMIVEVSTLASEVAGTVQWARAERGAGPRPVVIVFPDDPARWHEWSTSVRAATVSSDSTFSVRYVPPGDRYLAIAVDGLPPGEHREPDVLSSLRALARPLQVRPGERHELSLSAVTWPLR